MPRQKEAPASAGAAASTYNRAARRDWQKKRKELAAHDNPERQPEARDNPLFGDRKRGREIGEADAGEAVTEAKKKPAKKPKPEILKQDPAAELARKSKAAAKAARPSRAGGASRAAGKGGQRSKPGGAGGGRERGAGASGGKSTRRHGDAVDVALHAWEKLRQEKTPAEERSKLIDEVLSTFQDKLVDILQKHDGARVLQSCYRLGSETQREALLRGIGSSAAAVALSHYGHFFLLAVLRHGPPAHRNTILSQLTGRVRELVVHAEGSAVLQLAYSSVATPAQRTSLYRELWGKEYALLGSGAEHATLESLFAAEPTARPRVLRQLEVTLSKAAQKGLAVTSIVQRGMADLLELGSEAQRALLAGTLSGAAAHIMHERDGARVACGCLRWGLPKERKAVLKGLKGYVSATATHANGTLVLCAALETVDDTVLLKKALLTELLESLPEIATHAQGCLPLLAVLAPRAPRYFSPDQLRLLGADVAAGTSKKDPAARRDELLSSLLPPLLRLAEAAAGRMARSPHGGGVLYETIAAAAARDTAAAIPPLRALAAAAAAPADEPATAETGADGAIISEPEWAAHPLMLHPYGGRLLKRMVQGVPSFAPMLLEQLAGSLLEWATRGGGWSILALLESLETGPAVRAELSGKAGTVIAASAAPGCRSLAAALGVSAPGAAATTPKQKSGVVSAGMQKGAGSIAKNSVVKNSTAKYSAVGKNSRQEQRG
jgi:pumilio family protein 6